MSHEDRELYAAIHGLQLPEEQPKKKESGLEDDPHFTKRCSHISHRPPMGMVIPNGMRYRHVCAGCGKETLLYPPNVSC